MSYETYYVKITCIAYTHETYYVKITCIAYTHETYYVKITCIAYTHETYYVKITCIAYTHETYYVKGVLPNFEGAIFIIPFHRDNHKTPIKSIQMKNFSLLTKKQHFKLQQSGPSGLLW